MGQGPSKNRKKKDRPLLRVPKNVKPPDETVGGGIGGGASSSYSEQCIISFQVKVLNLPFLREGTRVHLEAVGDRYAVKVMDHQIALLNRTKSAMVTHCSEIGINYTGEIKTIKDEKYARFYRNTN